MTGAGMSSGLFPIATRAMMPNITAWKRISGTMPTASVAYSGTAAKLVRISVSISRRLGVIVPPDGKDDRMTVVRNRKRFMRRLDECERAHQRHEFVVFRMQRDARQHEHHFHAAPKREVDVRRGRADHLFELVVADRARLVRIEHHLHALRRLGLGLLDDPAPEARRLFPRHMTERIAADVFAERVPLAARSDAMRGHFAVVGRLHPLAFAAVVEEPGKDHDLAVDPD